MSRLVAAVLLGAVLAAPVHAQDAAPRLLTVITAPEPQTQLMALILTRAAMQKGAVADVLLCGPGGDLALAEAPEAARTPLPPRGLSPQGLLTRLIEAEATVSVCAIYLPGRGAGPGALIDGVTVASPAGMADLINDPAVKLLSF